MICSCGTLWILTASFNTFQICAALPMRDRQRQELDARRGLKTSQILHGEARLIGKTTTAWEETPLWVPTLETCTALNSLSQDTAHTNHTGKHWSLIYEGTAANVLVMISKWKYTENEGHFIYVTVNEQKRISLLELYILDQHNA